MKHTPQVKPRGRTAKAWRTGKPGTAPKGPIRVRTRSKAPAQKLPFIVPSP